MSAAIIIARHTEVNELCDRLGQPPGYPLAFETKRLMSSEATTGQDRLKHTNDEIAQRVGELEKVNIEIRDSRRAALNVMDDTLQARQAVERLNVELGESQWRFREMIDALPAAVYTTDAEGRLTHFNPAAIEFSGRVPELGTDQWCVSWRLYHADGTPMPHDECPMAIALKEGRTVRGVEAIIERPDGTRRWFTPYPTPLRDAQGQIVGGVNMLVDITERKQAEQAIIALANAELLRDMEERKKLEEQLLQAQKMEGIGALAGGIAHDFNNVLNIIQGYAFTLREYGAENEEIGESLTVINETVRRGSALVQQLLTLARKSSPKPESVNVNVLVEGLIALITQTFPKTIELSSALEADLPLIKGDKNQIEQALLNLCVNARDAISDRGKLIFRTQSVDGATLQQFGKTLEGRYVCLEVTDTGMGMDESVQKRIFEPFFTTKDKGQGTGLGLSMVYGIVKNHDGFIDVQSKPMCGASFRLYFPVAPAAERPAADLIQEPVSQTTAGSEGSTTILLVEDEKNMLDLLQKILLKRGYRVLTASDGETALDIYQRHKDRIDAVLLDIGLPQIAGRDVLLKMKEQKSDVKVIIASGYIEPDLKSEIDWAGVKHFLQKPYMPDEVVNAFQRLIDSESRNL